MSLRVDINACGAAQMFGVLIIGASQLIAFGRSVYDAGGRVQGVTSSTRSTPPDQTGQRASNLPPPLIITCLVASARRLIDPARSLFFPSYLHLPVHTGHIPLLFTCLPRLILSLPPPNQPPRPPHFYHDHRSGTAANCAQPLHPSTIALPSTP